MEANYRNIDTENELFIPTQLQEFVEKGDLKECTGHISEDNYTWHLYGASQMEGMVIMGQGSAPTLIYQSKALTKNVAKK